LDALLIRDYRPRLRQVWNVRQRTCRLRHVKKVTPNLQGFSLADKRLFHPAKSKRKMSGDRVARGRLAKALPNEARWPDSSGLDAHFFDSGGPNTTVS
jgi:hypothetical protein